MNTTNKRVKQKAKTQIPGHSFERGIIFSLDAGISFTIVLIGVLVFVFALNGYAESAKNISINFELEEKALMLADAMVKNNNSQNPLLGACIYDADKKRVRTNELSSTEIKRAQFMQFGKIFVKSISYETARKKEITPLTQKTSENCITSKRFVLIDGEKGIIFIQTCGEG